MSYDREHDILNGRINLDDLNEHDAMGYDAAPRAEKTTVTIFQRYSGEILARRTIQKQPTDDSLTKLMKRINVVLDTEAKHYIIHGQIFPVDKISVHIE